MNEQIVIEKYNPLYFNDLAELGVLFLNLHIEKSTEIQSFKDTWKPYIDRIWCDENYLIMIAFNREDKTLIAYAIAQYDDVFLGNLDCIILKEIFVKDCFRNSGIGKKILKEIECWGRGLGAKDIILKVRTLNQTAIHFYEEMGFSVYNYILKRNL